MSIFGDILLGSAIFGRVCSKKCHLKICPNAPLVDQPLGK